MGIDCALTHSRRNVVNDYYRTMIELYCQAYGLLCWCRIRNFIVFLGVDMAVARFALKMNLEDKNAVSRAAALVGTTMAAFVRTAA